MDPLTGNQAGAAHIIPHIGLDLITEIMPITPTATTYTTDRATTETTIETEDTNRTQGMTKESRTTKTGMITIRIETGLTTKNEIETGLTTEDNQTNINTTETSQRHKSSLNT